MAITTIDPALLSSLLNALTNSFIPHPSTAFLQPVLTPPATASSTASSTLTSGGSNNGSSTAGSSARLPPLPALVATTKHRLLSQNFSTPNLLSSTVAALPLSATDVTRSTFVLPQDTPVQVLDIEDVGSSKWERLLELEAERKGERLKGREIIRVIDNAAGGEHEEDPGGYGANVNNSTAGTGRSQGPFKLLLQDKDGKHIYGFEMARHAKIGFPPVMGIGGKLLLRKGCKIARGMVLIEPATVLVLGGKIERLESAWKLGREGRLRKLMEEGRDASAAEMSDR